jgi:hypothetical protein
MVSTASSRSVCSSNAHVRPWPSRSRKGGAREPPAHARDAILRCHPG